MFSTVKSCKLLVFLGLALCLLLSGAPRFCGYPDASFPGEQPVCPR